MRHDQAHKLRRQLNHSSSSSHARTISVISGKGGVGKSNTALNFSLELIRHGKKVLLFDLDIGMGNIDILMGMHSRNTIADMFQRRLSIKEIIETGVNGLSYIAGGSGIAELIEMGEVERDYFFQQFSELLPEYDFFIFDMSAGITRDSMFFILASDECLVITTPEPTSITDGYSVVKHIIKNRPGMPINLIMNRAPSQKEGEQSMERFKQAVSRFLAIEIKPLGILPDDPTVSKAVSRQIPYTLFGDRAAVSRAMRELAANYLENSGRLNSIGGNNRFLFKLKQLMTER
ncbi:MinD/ParA family protein [Virgibacillus sediminis]|uniref:MinD/ParA family protein n=1 Tax=Virgibacillus sediminis TaxID=202260 RepID=A0ABV7AAW4_9BACI